MKTTANPASRPPASAVSWVLALGVAIAIAGLLVAGGDAALGALVGTAIALGVLLFGTLTVAAVAALVPTAALLVAMTTYTLQVVVLAAVFVVLTEGGFVGETVPREWFGGAMVAVALVWSVAQVHAATRARIPVYDLPREQSVNTAPAAVSRPTEGGAR